MKEQRLCPTCGAYWRCEHFATKISYTRLIAEDMAARHKDWVGEEYEAVVQRLEHVIRTESSAQ